MQLFPTKFSYFQIDEIADPKNWIEFNEENLE